MTDKAPERIYWTQLPFSAKHDADVDAIGFAWRNPAEGRVAYVSEIDLKATEALALEKAAEHLKGLADDYLVDDTLRPEEASLYVTCADELAALIDPEAPALLEQRDRAKKVEGMRKAAENLSETASSYEKQDGGILVAAIINGCVRDIKALIAATQGESE